MGQRKTSRPSTRCSSGRSARSSPTLPPTSPKPTLTRSTLRNQMSLYTPPPMQTISLEQRTQALAQRLQSVRRLEESLEAHGPPLPLIVPIPVPRTQRLKLLLKRLLPQH